MIYKDDTDYSQSWRLVELGVPERTASRDHASWPTGWEGGREIPCWTLTDLLALLPLAIRHDLFWLRIRPHRLEGERMWVVEYEYLGRALDTLMVHAVEIVDAVYLMVVRLIELGHLKFDGDGQEG